MNNKRRATINNAIKELENAIELLNFSLNVFNNSSMDDLVEVTEEEQETIYNIPESMQDKADSMQETLDEIVGFVEELQEKIEEILNTSSEIEEILDNLKECTNRKQ